MASFDEGQNEERTDQKKMWDVSTAERKAS